VNSDLSEVSEKKQPVTP